MLFNRHIGTNNVERLTLSILTFSYVLRKYEKNRYISLLCSVSTIGLLLGIRSDKNLLFQNEPHVMSRLGRNISYD